MRIRSRYPEHLEYTSTTDWDGATGAHAKTGEGRELVLDTPPTYGGRGQGLCPDELFITSVIGCLNNTFLDFQRRFRLELISLHLEGRATVEFDSEGYKIVGIRVTGEVVVGPDEYDVGERCIELMKRYCHVYRSVSKCIPFEFDISLREATEEEVQPAQALD